jgi:cyclic pyranopterin phosphate synthase
MSSEESETREDAPTLTHQDSDGRIRMVDVGDKVETSRRAIARGRVTMSREAFEAVRDGQGPKGDALATAELAGIMGAKRTSDLIPLCHPLPLTKAKVKITAENHSNSFAIQAGVRTDGKTGVEMEALTAVSTAALTLYDMAKALDKSMSISDIVLVEKTGGKSGVYKRSNETAAEKAEASVSTHTWEAENTAGVFDTGGVFSDSDEFDDTPDPDDIAQELEDETS